MFWATSSWSRRAYWNGQLFGQRFDQDVLSDEAHGDERRAEATTPPLLLVQGGLEPRLVEHAGPNEELPELDSLHHDVARPSLPPTLARLWQDVTFQTQRRRRGLAGRATARDGHLGEAPARTRWVQ